MNSIGKRLINSIYTDGKFSKKEADVLKKLFNNNWSKRWWIVRDIINSGMINEKYFNEDWDKDGLTNINEIMQETNPLNELETDVSVDRLSKVLSKMKYKELIAVFNSCGSNEYTKRLYDLQGRTPNILLVGYDSNLVGNISLEIKRIMSYLDLGLNMKEVLKKIKAQQKAITIIGESEVFTNPLVYKKS